MQAVRVPRVCLLWAALLAHAQTREVPWCIRNTPRFFHDLPTWNIEPSFEGVQQGLLPWLIQFADVRLDRWGSRKFGIFAGPPRPERDDVVRVEVRLILVLP